MISLVLVVEGGFNTWSNQSDLDIPRDGRGGGCCFVLPPDALSHDIQRSGSRSRPKPRVGVSNAISAAAPK